MNILSDMVTYITTDYNNRKTEYTNETLLQFKEEMIAKQEAEQKAKAGSDEFGGFGGFGGGQATEEDETKDETDSVTKEQQVIMCYYKYVYSVGSCDHITIYSHLLPLLVLVVWKFPRLMLMLAN